MVLAPQLNPDSESPLYRQLAEQIRENIHTGRLLRGQRLPATRELAGQLGLNRTTIAAAYEILEAEGLISGHVGRGSFVTGEALVTPAPPDAEISFASSRPGQELFPLEQFRETCAEVLAGEQLRGILQLGSPSGYGPLRSYLLEQARQSGEARPEDDLLVVNGCQQGLDLLERALVGPTDGVAVENPVYPGLRNVFARSGARLHGIPIGEAGLDLVMLERVLQQERPRLLVVTPNFQNPTGVTLSLAQREELLRLARANSVTLVENDIYGELRYEGESLPTLKALDPYGEVVQIRSFSKVAFPGLRVGWVIGPRAVLSRLVEAKQWSDLHSDQLSQAVLLRFAQSGRLAEHRERTLQAGRERLHAVLSACASALPEGASYTRPQGGMSLWVELPAPLDAAELLPLAQRERVTYLPGKHFAVAGYVPGGLRLSFASLSPAQIRQGLEVLGRIFTQEQERLTAAPWREPAQAMV